MKQNPAYEFAEIFFLIVEIDKDIIFCPYCGQLSKIVWVHGHGQCSVCKTTVDECCRGEIIGNIENSDSDKESEIIKNNKNNKPQDENE